MGYWDCSLCPMEACHELLFCIFGDFYASGMQDAEITKSLVVHVLEGCNILLTEKQSVFLHIQVRVNSQTKSLECGSRMWGCAPHVWDSYALLNDFWEKKSDCFVVFLGDPPLDLNLKLYSHVTMPIWLCCF